MSYFSKGSIIADSREDAKTVMVVTSGQVQVFGAGSDFSYILALINKTNPTRHVLQSFLNFLVFCSLHQSSRFFLKLS